MTTTDQPRLIVDLRHEGQLLHLTLNTPSANVLDAAMLGAIEAALRAHRDDPALKGIAFEGAGKHFSFGASVEEHQAAQAPAMLKQFHGVFRLLAELAAPTFAIVRGQCLGGGLELASYCSWLFASPVASFGQPEIKLAVFAPMASLLLPWRIGGGAAIDLCVSGRSIDAEHARSIGLVHDVGDDPAAVCDAFFTRHIAPLSASSVRFAERVARLSLTRAMERDLPEIERMYTEELMNTHDANEGIAAFLEKRPPSFTGAGPVS